MRSKLSVSVYLFLALYGSTTIQSRLLLKNIKNFVWFPKQYYLGFFFLEKQLANILDRGFLLLRNTLLLYSLLLWWESLFSMVYTLLLYSLDPHGQNDWQRNEYTCFAWAGGTCPRFAWAGGTFFPVVLLCQFSVLAGNRFWFYILLMYLEYHTGVVLC